MDIGAYSSQSDGGVLWNGILDLSEDAYLPETRSKFPYFMAGDTTCPLKNCIMRT